MVMNLEKIGEVLFENNNVTISNRKNKKDMFSIWQWANAHDIFMSIYLTNQSNSVLDLIKYGNNIRNMAKQFDFQAAKSYAFVLLVLSPLSPSLQVVEQRFFFMFKLACCLFIAYS
jgi:hypothetical protein